MKGWRLALVLLLAAGSLYLKYRAEMSQNRATRVRGEIASDALSMAADLV